ncbi:MAG: hypothetical protein IK130_02395 [Oscillospiraceae bacterium]|nr:hypothetical protein [Oscillospiraceae bacterium]
MEKRLSERVALGGIVASLCIVLMFMSGVMPVLYIAAPMMAGMLMIILAEEVSVPWAWLTYTAVSLLSMIISFDKEAALMFVLFFGYYPILRPSLTKIRLRTARLLCKLVLYNLFLAADVLITIYVLGLPSFDDYSRAMMITLGVLANLLFLSYDLLLSRMRWFYRKYFVRRVLGKHRR